MSHESPSSLHSNIESFDIERLHKILSREKDESGMLWSEGMPLYIRSTHSPEDERGYIREIREITPVKSYDDQVVYRTLHEAYNEMKNIRNAYLSQNHEVTLKQSYKVLEKKTKSST
jgi:hypothetical protein